MGDKFFVRWKGEYKYELVDRDDLLKALNNGKEAESIYRAYEEIHSMMDKNGLAKLFIYT